MLARVLVGVAAVIVLFLLVVFMPFRPDGDKTLVTWAMYGRNGFMGKLVSLFIDCDKMCGPQFEKGLAELGELVAAAPLVNQGHD